MFYAIYRQLALVLVPHKTLGLMLYLYLLTYVVPRSPNHYAQQRTMVVMETVRAATLATARRLERLATEAKLKGSQCFQAGSF